MTSHTPVLLEEAIEYLAVRSHKNYIDATFGGGGYTREILKRNAPDGKVLATDANPQAIVEAEEDADKKEIEADKDADKVVETDGVAPEAGAGIPEPPTVSGFGGALDHGRLILVNDNFANIAGIVEAESRRLEKVEADGNADNKTERRNFKVSGVVFDLGLSSDLLERSGRGFSFQRDEPLILSYQLPHLRQGSGGQAVTSYQGKTGVGVVNGYSRDELERVLSEYGGVRQARKIAEGIARVRKESRIETTNNLREAVEQSVRSATPKLLAQVWQALRIEVNDELENLKKGLAGAWEAVEPGGRVVVVSFHSGEDRIVKNFFRDISRKKEAGSMNQELGKVLTKKPVRPSREEVKKNPRARSARLRAIKKISAS